MTERPHLDTACPEVLYARFTEHAYECAECGKMGRPLCDMGGALLGAYDNRLRGWQSTRTALGGLGHQREPRSHRPKGDDVSHRPDDVVATDTGSKFTAHSEGQFAAVCVDVVDLGINVETFPGQEPREVPKVALVFATGERQEEDDSLTLITTEMMRSANEKANLRKFLEAWRGRSYTVEQAEQGLPVSKLYGQVALISVEHVTTKRGKKFAKIRSISPLPKAMPAPDPEILGKYERPKFYGERKAAYATALQKHRGFPADETPPPEMPVGEDEDDDLPF